MEKAYGSYITEMDQDLAIAAINAVEPVVRGRSTFPLNSRGAVIRDQVTRRDYDSYRYAEAMPRNDSEMVSQCEDAYYSVPELRSIIDLMSSFAAQGIRVMHPVKSREVIYKAWARKVRMSAVTQQMFRHLLRVARAIIKRDVAKLSASDLRDIQKGLAAYQPEAVYKKLLKPNKNEFPVKYTFLNPKHVDVPKGELATFMGEQVYILKLTSALIVQIKTANTPTQKELVARLPTYIREAVERGDKFILLDNDQTRVFHYMKDDYQNFAVPITFSILPDIKLFQKLKLADSMALDGVISKVRIFRLGSLPDKIQPGPGVIKKFQEILQSAGHGGTLDIAWDAAIDMIESKTDTAAFLGPEKYKQTLQSIHAAWGIPQSLTGGAQGAGFTNNAISLKTIIEKLQFLREIADEFWYEELRLVQEALGDPTPPQLVYDNMNLFDEAAEKMLWIQLIDRDLVSPETIQEKFGLIPQIEEMRNKRDHKKMASGKKPQKVGPFHDIGGADHQMLKTALGQGTIAPTEAGVKKKPKAKGDKSLLDHQAKVAQNTKTPNSPSAKPNGKSGQGRPVNSKDSKTRKKRTPKPRTKAWIAKAGKIISEESAKFALERCKKTALSDMTDEEKHFHALVRAAVLFEHGNEIDLSDEDLSGELYSHMLSLPDDLTRFEGLAKLTWDEAKEVFLGEQQNGNS